MQKDLFNIAVTQLDYTISDTSYDIGKKSIGKVRDIYDLENKLLIITTDRISAFDRVVGTVPFKGELLNNLSLFWFEKTKDIVANHIIEKVGNQGVLVKKCKIFPIEMIVRGYLTGSAWREYSKTGMLSGIKLPGGLKKDCKLEKPILTPTTKATIGHDIPISVEEIVEQKIIPESTMEKIENIAIQLYNRGNQIVRENNLILVDTKYEFGLLDGTLILADEVHTPDSSRYWSIDSEHKMLDKEYLRQWLISNNFTGDGELPQIPFEVIVGILERYLDAYQKITGSVYQLKNYDTIYSLNQAINERKNNL